MPLNALLMPVLTAFCSLARVSNDSSGVPVMAAWIAARLSGVTPVMPSNASSPWVGVPSMTCCTAVARSWI